MAVVIATGHTGTTYPLTHGRVCYEWFRDGTVTATTAAAAAQAAPTQSQNVIIDLIGATGMQVDQFQQFADTLNEAARQGLLTNLTVRGA